MHKKLQEISWRDITRLTLDKDEQEFTLTSMREETLVSCFCSDNLMLTKLKAAMKENPDEYKCYVKHVYSDGSIGGYQFIFPKKYLKFITSQRRYVMSDEQREASAERMKLAREAKRKIHESVH